MKTDANGNKLTKKRIERYNESFRKYPGGLLRAVTDAGEGIVTFGVYQHRPCGCKVIGNGSIPFPFTVKPCKKHSK